MNINVFSVWTIVSWSIWAIGKRWFSSNAVNCIWAVPWSFYNKVITVVACYCLGAWKSYISQWEAKRSADYSCVVQGEVVIANLVPFGSIENFSSSPNSKEFSIRVGHIFGSGQSVVSTCGVIWSSWTGDYDVFWVIAITDRSIWALAKVIFVSRAWNIVHQNWFLVSIRKLIVSGVWQAVNICPVDSSESGIERSEENISCSHVEIRIITNCPPMSSIVNLSSSFPSSLSDISVMWHSKISTMILWNERWTLILEICFDRFDAWLICENSLCISTGEWNS